MLSPLPFKVLEACGSKSMETISELRAIHPMPWLGIVVVIITTGGHRLGRTLLVPRPLKILVAAEILGPNM